MYYDMYQNTAWRVELKRREIFRSRHYKCQTLAMPISKISFVRATVLAILIGLGALLHHRRR